MTSFDAEQDGALRAIAVLCRAPERHAARALLRDSGAIPSITLALGMCQDRLPLMKFANLLMAASID